MGFLDKVRSIKNAITGGGATVSVEAGQCRLGSPFEVTVTAEVGEDDLPIDGARLRIEGKEVVEVIGSDASISAVDDDTELSEALITAEHTTVALDLEVTGAQTLGANQQYEWTVQAELPADVPPRFAGKYCQHSFLMCASLDAFGNDPDSGWVELEVSN